MIKVIFKTVVYTVMTIAIMAIATGVWISYERSVADAKEMETQKIVDTLAEITTHKKPDFERANNQTFINSPIITRPNKPIIDWFLNAIISDFLSFKAVNEFEF